MILPMVAPLSRRPLTKLPEHRKFRDASHLPLLIAQYTFHESLACIAGRAGLVLY
jgi:hypothetical protein